MKVATLAGITFLQLAVLCAAGAEARSLSPTRLAQAGSGGAQGIEGIQSIQADGPGDKKLDINVTVGEPMMHSSMWYSQPIWIAVFIAGGLALLALLAMALRGSGATGATIVK